MRGKPAKQAAHRSSGPAIPGASHSTQLGGTRKAPQALSQRVIVDRDAAFGLTVGGTLANIVVTTMHGATQTRSCHIGCE
jgi:hypothetical protein